MLRVDINLVWTIVNLLVWYWLIKKFLIRPITSIMAQRQESIDRQLSGAGEANAKAMELKSRYEEKIKSSGEEAEKAIAKAKLDAQAEYDRIVGEAQSTAVKILENARKAAETEREKTLRDAMPEIAGMVVTAAAKVLGENASEEKNKSLYSQFLAKAGDFDDADRG